MTIKYAGPLAAARAVDSLADDIGGPIVSIIQEANLSDVEKQEVIQKIESVLTDVFMGDKVFSIRDYIYRPARETPR